tara:strand:+ start:40 stop:294 length:255 start_codon:yes stop_codon:yes gene_type:complete
MKTITITLNEEQERLLMNRIVRSTWRLTDKDITHLRRNYKNPGEWTKGCVASAKKSRAILDEEHNQMRVVINQIQKQLGVSNES